MKEYRSFDWSKKKQWKEAIDLWRRRRTWRQGGSSGWYWDRSCWRGESSLAIPKSESMALCFMCKCLWRGLVVSERERDFEWVCFLLYFKIYIARREEDGEYTTTNPKTPFLQLYISWSPRPRLLSSFRFWLNLPLYPLYLYYLRVTHWISPNTSNLLCF